MSQACIPTAGVIGKYDLERLRVKVDRTIDQRFRKKNRPVASPLYRMVARISPPDALFCRAPMPIPPTCPCCRDPPRIAPALLDSWSETHPRDVRHFDPPAVLDSYGM